MIETAGRLRWPRNSRHTTKRRATLSNRDLPHLAIALHHRPSRDQENFSTLNEGLYASAVPVTLNLRPWQDGIVLRGERETAVDSGQIVEAAIVLTPSDNLSAKVVELFELLDTQAQAVLAKD